jgi:fermentation-respiration switch protein FrsA (DUF1100 family)
VQRITWLFATPAGRMLARRVGGVRLAAAWGDPEAPVEVVDRIDAPLLIVHGDDDHFFPVDSARELLERAREPKRLLILPGFGHAEDGFTPAFAELLGKEIDAMLDPPA